MNGDAGNFAQSLRTKRGRPADVRRRLICSMFPQAKSRRSKDNVMALMRCQGAIQGSGDEALMAWFRDALDRKRLTVVVYALGRLPYCGPSIVREVIDEINCGATAAEIVKVLRVLRRMQLEELTEARA